MPDHVHLILTPFYVSDGPISIPRIMQGIKSTSAHKINKILRREGKVRQAESFDQPYVVRKISRRSWSI
jgi:REP element-mobilizing transposase RayT